MMKSGARWVLVGSLVSILVMGGLGLAMGQKAEEVQKGGETEVKQEAVGEKEWAKKALMQEKEEEIKARLIWSKEFDEKISEIGVSSSFWEKTFQQRPGIFGIFDPGPSFPLKFVVGEDKITFFDNKGKVKKEEKTSRGFCVGLSDNREFIGFVKESKSANIKTLMGSFTLMDNEGRMIWEKDNIFVFMPVISPRGDRVIMQQGNPYRGILSIIVYDTQGEIYRIPNKWADPTVAVSPNGEYILVAGAKPSSPTVTEEKLTAQIGLFDKIGNLLWEKNIDNEEAGDGAVVSSQGNVVVVTHDRSWKKGYLYFINKTGEIVAKIKYPHRVAERMIRLSADEKFVAMASWNHIALYNITTGSLAWNFIGDKSTLFESISISEDAKYIAVGNILSYHPLTKDSPKYKSNRAVYVFERGKGKIFTKEYGHELFWIVVGYRVPNVCISPDGKILMVRTLKNIYTYNLEEEGE